MNLDTLFVLVGSLVVLAILWPWVVYVGVRQVFGGDDHYGDGE